MPRHRPITRPRPLSILSTIEEQPPLPTPLPTSIAHLRTEILARLEMLRPQFDHLEQQHRRLTVLIDAMREYEFQRARLLGRVQMLVGKRVVIDPEAWREVVIARARMRTVLLEVQSQRALMRGEIDALLRRLPRGEDGLGVDV